MQERELAEQLLKDGLINQSQLDQATQLQEATGGELAQILVKMGFVSDTDVTTYLSKLEGVDTVDLTDMILPEVLVKSIPRDLIEKHLVIPIHKEGNRITLAMTNPEDFDAINEIQFLTGMKLEPVMATKESIRKAITEFFYRVEQKSSEQVEGEAPLEAVTTEGGESAEADGELRLSEWQLKAALIPLLIDKGIITEEELRLKATELEMQETPQG